MKRLASIVLLSLCACLLSCVTDPTSEEHELISVVLYSSTIPVYPLDDRGDAHIRMHSLASIPICTLQVGEYCTLKVDLGDSLFATMPLIERVPQGASDSLDVPVLAIWSWKVFASDWMGAPYEAPGDTLMQRILEPEPDTIIYL